MKKFLVFAFILIVVIIVCLIFIWKKDRLLSDASENRTKSKITFSDEVNEETIQQNANAKTAVDSSSFGIIEKTNFMLSLYRQSIELHGRVIDNFGDPVPEAKIEYTANNNPIANSHVKQETYSGEYGEFKISGVQGRNVYISILKEGYRRNPKSHKNVEATEANKSTLSDPIELMLIKQGESEPLIVKGFKSTVDKHGKILAIDLVDGNKIASGRGDVLVEAITEDNFKNAAGRYDWRLKIAVPEGGLIVREEKFDFEAPESGYRGSDEIVVRSTAKNWTPRFEQDYFIKIRKNKFARMKFVFTSAGAHYVRVTSYYNPSGSRNLEYDPTKRISP